MIRWERDKNRIIFGALAMTLIVVVILSSQWYTYTSVEGKYRVSMPGWAMRQNIDVPTQAGTITLQAFTVIQMLHRSTYTASYNTLPPAAMSPESLLEEACTAAVNQKGGKIVAMKDLSSPDYIGKDVTFTATGLGTVRLRMMMVDNRLYTLMVSPEHNKARVDRFFKSFELLK